MRDERTDRAGHVRGELRPKARHRWFGSFHSSQALAQSVFANLKNEGKLGLLAEIRGEGDVPVLFDEAPAPKRMVMECSVGYLGEREGRSTEVDVLFEGTHRVCVECKFTEEEVGSCSRPRLKPTDLNFEQDHCDGSYRRQRGRSERCSLSEIGVQYWKHLPALLGWRTDVDHEHCPLRMPYQLVRNILAGCVRQDGTLDVENAHAVLVYDGRNPSFQRGGDGFEAWSSLRAALCSPGLMRRCSWQDVLSVLRTDSHLAWLTNELEANAEPSLSQS